MTTPEGLLRLWLEARLPDPARQWLAQAVDKARGSGRDADLYLAYSLVPRHTGKEALKLTPAELAAAAAARPGWQPARWRVDEAARLLLLLAATGDPATLQRRIDQLCATADLTELATLYRGLPLYPEPDRYRLRAAEGVRTNMRVVFEAVAHDNPYPKEQLPQPAWNQMVLKALFVGSLLAPIVGLDDRANEDLARMLCDYAHERRSASRTVSPELWRCVGPFATDRLLPDLRRVLDSGTPLEQEAAILALSRSPAPQAAAWVRERPALASAVASGELSWQTVAAALEAAN
jgi:hypothetical protein